MKLISVQCLKDANVAIYLDSRNAPYADMAEFCNYIGLARENVPDIDGCITDDGRLLVPISRIYAFLSGIDQENVTRKKFLAVLKPQLDMGLMQALLEQFQRGDYLSAEQISKLLVLHKISLKNPDDAEESDALWAKFFETFGIKQIDELKQKQYREAILWLASPQNDQIRWRMPPKQTT